MEGATHTESYFHGPAHWRIVARNGIELAASTPGADVGVAFLFGLTHDSKRLNDDEDPQHGPRAGAFVKELHAKGLFALSDERLALLVKACETHTTAGTTKEPTLGVCYDADRLDLWRVGVCPNPAYLSTPAARMPDRIMAGRKRNLDLDWSDLYQRLSAASIR